MGKNKKKKQQKEKKMMQKEKELLEKEKIEEEQNELRQLEADILGGEDDLVSFEKKVIPFNETIFTESIIDETDGQECDETLDTSFKQIARVVEQSDDDIEKTVEEKSANSSVVDM